MKKHLIVLLVFSLNLLSCGLNDAQVEDHDILDLSTFNPTCEINTEKLAQILEQDVHSELTCLESNLNQFAQFVKRSDHATIKRKDLEKFVNYFFVQQSEEINKILLFVYDLTTLLFKEKEGQIQTSTLPSIFKLFHLVNNHGRKLFQLFKENNNEKYWEKRSLFHTEIESIATVFLDITRPFQKHKTSLNIPNFLQRIQTVFNLNDENFDIDLIENFLFLKKLLVGGVNEVLTSDEVENLLTNLDKIFIRVLDIYHIKGKNFQSDAEKHYFTFDIIHDLRSFLYELDEDELIFTHDNLMVIIDKVFKTGWDLDRMGGTFINIKPKFIGGTPFDYTFSQVKLMISWALEISGRMYFNDITYDHFESILDSPAQITDILYPDLPEYRIFGKKWAKKNWAHFKFVAIHYRYFADNDGINHYFDQYHRFRSGFNQISLLRYFLDKVMKVYGHIPEGEKKRQANTDDITTFLKDIEGAAREFGLWPKNFRRFVDEALNGSDLFQFNGNGNGLADHDELTEYILTILSANKHAEKIHDRLKNVYCPIVDEEQESFELECYREYFLHIFFNELNLEKYYDRLKQYVLDNGMEKAQTYMVNLEFYSREIPDPNLPLTKTDLKRLVIAFSNLEAAFIRFDKNKNSTLERSEIDHAYKIFKNLLVTFAKLEQYEDKFIHNVFLYLIKYMKNPKDNMIRFGKFYVFENKNKITGDRFNISAILRMFSASPKE